MKKRLPIPLWYEGSRLGAMGAVAIVALAGLTLYIISAHSIILPAPNASQCEKTTAFLRGEVTWRDRLITELKREVAGDKTVIDVQKKALKDERRQRDEWLDEQRRATKALKE